MNYKYELIYFVNRPGTTKNVFHNPIQKYIRELDNCFHSKYYDSDLKVSI